jgi:hypothetical protein
VIAVLDFEQYADYPQVGGHLATWQAMLLGAYFAFVLFVFYQAWRKR